MIKLGLFFFLFFLSSLRSYHGILTVYPLLVAVHLDFSAGLLTSLHTLSIWSLSRCLNTDCGWWELCPVQSAYHNCTFTAYCDNKYTEDQHLFVYFLHFLHVDVCFYQIISVFKIK